MNRQGKNGKYRPLLDNLRAIARSEERDWEEEDWRRALRRATAGKPGEFRPETKPRPAWVWAYATALVVLLGGAAAATRSFFRAAGPTLMAGMEPADGGGAAGLSPQDRLSVTLVSAESGLRVYWYFDKEFDWKEEIR